MSGRSSRCRVAAAAVAALLAAACGGSESSGLPTLVEAATTAPVVDPEEIEPVSEPTAATNLTSDTAETAEPPSSVAADTADGQAGETAGAVAAEPEGTTGGDAGEADAIAGGASAEPDTAGQGPGEADAAGGASAEPEDPAGEELVVRDDMTDEERLLAFAECMRDNGVDFPDPVVEADGTVTFGFRPGAGLAALREIGRDPDLPAARETCEGLVEGVAFGGGQGGIDLVEIQDSLLEFARCMRDHGIDIGDPDLSRLAPGADNDGQPPNPFGVIDVNDPDFAPAFEVCQQQLPTAGQGARVGGGS